MRAVLRRRSHSLLLLLPLLRAIIGSGFCRRGLLGIHALFALLNVRSFRRWRPAPLGGRCVGNLKNEASAKRSVKSYHAHRGLPALTASSGVGERLRLSEPSSTTSSGSCTHNRQDQHRALRGPRGAARIALVTATDIGRNCWTRRGRRGRERLTLSLSACPGTGAGVPQIEVGGSVPSTSTSMSHSLSSVGARLEDRPLAVLFLRWNLRNPSRLCLPSVRLQAISDGGCQIFGGWAAFTNG